MADVQLENGYTRIANELLEALAMYDFTGQERKLLDAVIRLSYGCGKKTATFPSWAACESFGLSRQHIHSPKNDSGILDKLVLNDVLLVDYDTKTVGIQKYYRKWKIAPKKIASKKKFHALIDYNLKCNLQVANVTHRLQDDCNPQVTDLSPTGYNDVTHRLQEHTVDPHHDKPETAPKERKEIKDIYIYTDLLGKLEFLPGIIDISKDIDKEYFEYIKSFDAEMIDTVLAEAQRRTKLKSGHKDKLQRKSVLKFIAGGLENYERLYAGKQPAKKLTAKEQAVAQGIKIIQAYQAHPDMIQSKRQLSTLSKHYEQYEDYGELVKMTLEEFEQVIEGE